MIVILEQPRTTALTTLQHVKSDLRLTDVNAVRDEVLERLIIDASAAIVSFCDRTFARESVTEKLQGHGQTELMLNRTPIAAVSEVRFRSEVIDPADDDSDSSGWMINDAEAGFLFREDRFDDTPARDTFITSSVAPMPGVKAWAVDYVGGYLMPGDNLTASGVMSASIESDGTHGFNLPEDDDLYFPILVAGDTVRTAGFNNAANNRRHTVVSRTRTRLVVSSILVAEPASGVASLTCQTLPGDLERRAIDVVKQWFLSVTKDMSITSESVDDWSAAYASAPFLAKDNYGLPPIVVAGLEKWARVV
jgi:hypothetical protein